MPNSPQVLIDAIQQLSLARSVDAIAEVVRRAARALTGADGATFVLRDGDRCYYVDEEAIGPLWKGQRFPIENCISGWVMNHAQAILIPDILVDPRIPQDVYRETFVKSLAMVPIRQRQPIGAIGNYWSTAHAPSAEALRLLQLLADSTSVALENVQLFTELRQALHEEKIARDGLQRQLELRDDFISVAAHELKTPLTPLQLQIHYLDRIVKSGAFKGHPHEADLRRMTGVFSQRMGDFTQLVENVLDVSRIRLGQYAFRFDESLDLSATVTVAAAPFLLQKECPLGLEIEPGIRGRADPLKVPQLVRNLLSNAVKYGARKPIKLSLRSRGDRVLLQVRDHGIGMDAECLSRIFERFSREESFRFFGGLGLGLYITQQIVEGHDGQISAQSRRDEGTTITVDLPRAL
jgi:signal transduction histidine kinase